MNSSELTKRIIKCLHLEKYSDEEKENWLYGHISQLSDTIIRETLEKLCERIMELDPQMQDTTSVTFHNSKENAAVTVTIPGYFPDELSEMHRQEAYKKLREITSEENLLQTLRYLPGLLLKKKRITRRYL